MRPLGLAFLALLALPLLAQSSPFPPGTTQFFNVQPYDVVAAADGGVWVATSQGIVHYTVAGPGQTLTVPGGTPGNLALASDGSIWFSTSTLVGRISPGGTVLEQYTIAGAYALTVASDGALWYIRSFGSIVGRIAGGTPTEFPVAFLASSLASAPGGEVWILPAGTGGGPDSPYRMTPAGAMTEIPLGIDVLFGRLQSLADGTLFLSAGIHNRLYRLAPGSQTVEQVVTDVPPYRFVSDPAGNVWTGSHAMLGYTAASGQPHFAVDMPRDPRECSNIPAYAYDPLAVDSSGGVWIVIFDDAAYIGTPLPCNEPTPPPLPMLIRINPAVFLPALNPSQVPALSPGMLLALGLGLALAGVAAMRFR